MKRSIDFLKNPDNWTKKLPKSDKHKRNWITTVEITFTLSDGYTIVIPQGYIWDAASIPKWLWWLFKPIDQGAIGDLVHDYLWDNKIEEIIRFDESINKARKFSDKERVIIRNNFAPKKKIKTFITNLVIRAIGSLFYTRQLDIPR